MPAVSQRLARISFAGMVAWVALLFLPLATGPGPAEEAAHLVLLVPLALAPLYLAASVPFSFAAPPRSLVVASWLLLPGALGATASFLVPVGPVAGALVVPWGIAAAAVAAWALLGLRRRQREGALDAAEVALAVGWATLPGGAVWLFLARSGVGTGYGELVELLTAAHVHYGGALAAIWAGLLGRTLAGPRLRGAYRALVVGLVVGFWGVAAGIALGRGPAGGSAVETAGVLLLTASAVGLGVLGVVRAGGFEDRAAGLMVAVSGGALALAMGLAVWFHLGARLGGGPDVAWMVERHGWLNAFGVGLWGALGWRRLRPRGRAARAEG